MIACIIVVGLAFAWLLVETDWMTDRLPMGELTKPKLAEYGVFQALKRSTGQWLRCGTNDGNGSHMETYQIYVSPGIDNVLCGWEWLDKHCADMVGYQPNVELITGGVRYNMIIKAPSVLRDVMKANKLNKKQRQAYA